MRNYHPRSELSAVDLAPGTDTGHQFTHAKISHHRTVCARAGFLILLAICLKDGEDIGYAARFGDLALIGYAHDAVFKPGVIAVLECLTRHTHLRCALGERRALMPRAFSGFDDDEERLELGDYAAIVIVGNKSVFRIG